MFELRPSTPSRSAIRVKDGVTIGRNETNDVIWSAPFISRLHARLICDDDRLYLVPEASDETLIHVNHATTRKRVRRELVIGDIVHFIKDKDKYSYTVAPYHPDVIDLNDDDDDDDDDEVQVVEASTQELVVPKKRKRSDTPPPPPPEEEDDADIKEATLEEPPTTAAGEMSQLGEDLECIICAGLLSFCHALPCGHVACGSCLLEWLGKNRQCPECRANVDPGTVLAPVHLVDRIIEKQLPQLPEDDVRDYRERSDAWRRTRGSKLTVPASPARPQQQQRGGRVIGGRPRDIRAHFQAQPFPTSYASFAQLPPPPPPPLALRARPPVRAPVRSAAPPEVIDLASDSPPATTNNNNVIDLASA